MRFRPFALFFPIVSGALVAGCSTGADAAQPVAASTVTRTAVVTQTVQPTVTVTVTATPTADPAAFPKGFPKTVSVSKIPSKMRREANGASQAIAIAPGVWTALSPGASVLESATYGTRFGYCASIQAYERKFTVEQVGNSCW